MKERLIDILLLRIIEAYKPADANLSDEERLAQAKQALFGTKQGVGRKHINDDKAMLAMARATLKDSVPTLTHEYLAARARLLGEAFDRDAPPEPKLKSQRAMILAALEDESIPAPSKHSEEAAYKRLKRKMDGEEFTLGNLVEIEGLEEGTLRELEIIEEILMLLQKLDVSVGHKGPN